MDQHLLISGVDIISLRNLDELFNITDLAGGLDVDLEAGALERFDGDLRRAAPPPPP